MEKRCAFKGDGKESFPMACRGLMGLTSLGGVVLRGVRSGGRGGPISERTWHIASRVLMDVCAEEPAAADETSAMALSDGATGFKTGPAR